MLTVAFLSHHSNHLISKNIEKITSYGLNISFLIIENSLNYSLKVELESKYNDIVKVHIPNENLGFARGMNKALELSKDNFVFLSPPDVDLSFDCISNLLECIKNFNDFVLLAPTYKDESSFKNYDESIFSKDFNRKKIFQIANKYNLREVDWIDSSVIVNKSKVDNLKIMDENFFLYFETMDMCLNFKKKKMKMFIIDNIKFEHLGGASHEKKFNYEAGLSRNWHYNWSKFYYFKKNFSYFYALKKSLPILFKLSIKYILNLFSNKKEKKHLIKAELNGIITSMFLKKSSYRPFLKKIN
jgi:GT2 family glycosyltransferase